MHAQAYISYLDISEIALVELCIAEVYAGGGYTRETEIHLQKAEDLLNPQSQTLPQNSPQLTQQISRANRHAKVMRFQVALDKGEFIHIDSLDATVQDLETDKKNKDPLLLAWIKRIRSAATNLPFLSLQDAKDSFSLIISILPELHQDTTKPTIIPPKFFEANLSRWKMIRHFLSSVECVIHNLEQAGKPQEAYVIYRRALSVALRSGAIAYP